MKSKVNQQDREPGEICKTSIPVQIGQRLKFIRKIALLVVRRRC
jgi:hypothetical protein